MSNHPRGDVETVELLDGSRVRIRPIAPDDRSGLVRAFGHLSARSRYRRFLSPVSRLTTKNLDYFTEIDHVGHEALVAVSEGDELVGVARYVRLADREDVAEGAVTVVDEWQGRGVGTALLRRLAKRAREAGLRRLLGICLAENREMIKLFHELGCDTETRAQGDGTVEVEVELPEDITSEHAKTALRGAFAV